jgi:hypothetical protein
MNDFNIFGFHFHKTNPGEISHQATWVCFYGDCYFQTNDSLIKLILEIIKEYKQDKHLTG